MHILNQLPNSELLCASRLDIANQIILLSQIEKVFNNADKITAVALIQAINTDNSTVKNEHNFGTN